MDIFEPFQVAEKQQNRKKKIKMDWHQFKEAEKTQREISNIEQAMAAESGLFTTDEFLNFLERHFNVSNLKKLFHTIFN